MAEVISDNANVRAATREKALKFSTVRAEKIADAADEKSVYSLYYAFETRVDRLRPHQVLALNRGEHSIMPEMSRQFERALIVKALAHTGGRRIEASHLLGMGRNTLTRKLKELGMETIPG